MSYTSCTGEKLKPEKTIYCQICDERYKIKELIYWDDDGGCAPILLCPGCDSDLVSLDDTDWS